MLPRQGETWQAGSLHYLPGETEYSLDGGAWTRLPAGEVPDDPNFVYPPVKRVLWKVPAGHACRFRVGADVVEIQIAPSAERRYRWTLVTDNAAFAGRDGAGALTFQGQMWLLGGWNPKDQKNFPNDCNSEVWTSRNGREWQLVNPAAPWEKRHTAGYVVHHDRLWVVGGDPIQNHYQNDVWCSRDGLQWERVLERAPWADRVLHYTVAHADRIWVMGGQKISARVKGHLPGWPLPAEEVFYNDVWCSTDGLAWTCVTERAPWAPRGQIGGAAVKDGYIWLLGGGQYYERYFPEVWRSRDGANWERVVALTPWYPRYYHDVAVFDDRLWVMEGASKPTGNRNDVWYSTDGVNWYEVSGTPWATRHAASVFVHAGTLWMVAGNNMFPDVWRLERLETGSEESTAAFDKRAPSR